MRVAEDDDIRVVPSCQFRRRRASDFVAVTDVHADAVYCNDDLLAQPRCTGRVGVAEYSFDRRNQAELVQNFSAADVARVKNEIDARQRYVDAGPKEPMRIGDEANDVRLGG